MIAGGVFAIFTSLDFWIGLCFGVVVGVFGLAMLLGAERQEGGPPPPNAP